MKPGPGASNGGEAPARAQLTIFDGATFSHELDSARLAAQLTMVRRYMLTHGWVTLREVSQALHYPEASISARIRDLRKDRFGAHTVERRRVPEGNGLHQYRLVLP